MIENISGPDITASSVSNDSVKRTSTPLSKARYFFVIMSFLFLIIAAVGFIPSYQDMYARVLPIHWLAHVHGALMTSWLLVFITQTLLGATGHLKFHRRLGLLSVVLGILIWISMWIVSARALIGYNPPVDHFLFDVLLVQFYGVALFGLFFTWGILVRKNAAAHKRLLFLATLVLIQAGIDRIHWLPDLHLVLSSNFIYMDALLFTLFIYDWVTLGRIHKITRMGALFYIIVQVGITMLWGSASWHSFWFNLVNKFR